MFFRWISLKETTKTQKKKVSEYFQDYLFLVFLWRSLFNEIYAQMLKLNLSGKTHKQKKKYRNLYNC